jgi:hypothetical protein
MMYNLRLSDRNNKDNCPHIIEHPGSVPYGDGACLD